jgi:hypothetical protein
LLAWIKKKRAQVRSIIRKKNKHKLWMRGGRRVKKLRGKAREKEREREERKREETRRCVCYEIRGFVLIELPK